MSETLKPHDPATDATTAAEVSQLAHSNTEVDKTIPEPVVGQPSTPEQPPAAATVVEEIKSEKPKENEKSDDHPRGLLKEFQSKIAGVFPKKSEKPNDVKESKKDENVEEKEEREEKRTREGKDVKENKDRRSVSRKRNSLFGGFGLGKKEEKPSTEEISATESPKPEPNEPSPEVSSAPVVATSDVPAERPVPSKRASIFDSFRHQFSKKEKPETSETAVSKDIENSAASPPVIPAVNCSEPEKDTSTSEVITETVRDAQAAVETKVDKFITKSEKRKSSLPFGLGLGKKEKATTSDEEAVEKPLSPFAKLRATVKSKTSPKLFNDKKEEASSSQPAIAKAEGVDASQKIVSAPEPAAQAQAAEVAASA